MLWAAVVKWSNHVLNRCPNAALIEMTPEKGWTGRVPLVAYLRVFGCLTYAHVPKEKRTKLDDMRKMCAFIGFSDESKGYTLFDLLTNQVILSRDVIFVEDQNGPWTSTYETHNLMQIEEGETDNTGWSSGASYQGREDHEQSEEERRE